MTYLKQNFLAVGLLAISLGSSVGLGYAMNQNEKQSVIEKNCVKLKIDQPKFKFNHSIKLLSPQLG